MKRTDLLHLPIDKIQIEEGFNPRTDYGDISSLADSIVAHGVKVPIRAYKDRGSDVYVLVDGHRRFTAATQAIKEGKLDPETFLIPLIAEPKGTNEEDRVLGTILYNDGKKLTMLEEAEVYKRLISYGRNSSEIAKKVSKTRVHIDNCLLLLEASPELLEKVKSGEVSASFVVEELRGSSSEEVLENVVQAQQETGTKKVSKKHVSKVKSKKKSANISTETVPEPKSKKVKKTFSVGVYKEISVGTSEKPSTMVIEVPSYFASGLCVKNYKGSGKPKISNITITYEEGA